MAFKKFGTGDVTETEGPLSKAAAKEQGWSEQDDQDLQSENDQADKEGS